MHGHHPGLAAISDSFVGAVVLGIVFNVFSWYSDHINALVGTVAIAYYVGMYALSRKTQPKDD